MSLASQFNQLKLLHHHRQLQALAEGRACAPVMIRLKPTNLCNHGCRCCCYGLGRGSDETKKYHYVDQALPSDRIPWEKMRELIADLAAMGVKAVTISGGGEPLTYPHIAETAALIRGAGLALALITNGQLLRGERAEAFYNAAWVRVSLDSVRPLEYAAARSLPPEALGEVLDNISDFAKNKNEACGLWINFVVGSYNYTGLYEAAARLREAGAGYLRFTALNGQGLDYHLPFKDEALGQIEKAAHDFSGPGFTVDNAYLGEYDQRKFRPAAVARCYGCELSTVVAADCGLYLCRTRAYDSRALIGSIRERPFREVWFEPETRAALAALEPRRDCDSLCVFESRNRLLADYFNVDPDHMGFI